MRKHPHSGDRHLRGGVTILMEDIDLIVVNKPSGLLSVPTPREAGISAQDILEDFIRKGQSRSHKTLFAVNRLDKFTSGVLVFSKTHAMREKMHETWAEQTHKTYVAVVNGQMGEEKSGSVTSYLVEDDKMVVRSSTDPKNGKPATTEWNVLREGSQRSLLEVSPITGRKNQIRVHMSDLGHPIVGDRKYGVKNGRERLALHAWKLSFIHPRDGGRMEFEAPMPPEFNRLAERGGRYAPAQEKKPESKHNAQGSKRGAKSGAKHGAKRNSKPFSKFVHKNGATHRA